MTVSAQRDPELQRLHEAAEWVQRLSDCADEEPMTAEWLEWCARDTQNLAAFEQLQKVWLGFGTSTPNSGDIPVIGATRTDPTAAHPPAGLRLGGRRPVWRLAAALLLAAMGAAWFLARLPEPLHYSTGVREQRSELLADGSRVDLGANSQVTVRYTDTRRDIELASGEAFFSVAHNSQRPFIVHSGAVSVTAVGTAFDVRRGIDHTIITVSQGRVQIADLDQSNHEAGPLGESIPQAATSVEAGQRVTFSPSSHQLMVANVDPRIADSWRDGALEFVAEPLSEVVNDVNRYSNDRITIADPAIGRLQFTGTVSQDGVRDWLKALEKIFPLKVLDRGEQGILLETRVSPTTVLEAVQN